MVVRQVKPNEQIVVLICQAPPAPVHQHCVLLLTPRLIFHGDMGNLPLVLI